MIAFPMQLYSRLLLWNDEVLNQVASTLRYCHRAPAAQQRCMSRYSHIPAAIIESAANEFQHTRLQSEEIIYIRLLNVPCWIRSGSLCQTLINTQGPHKFYWASGPRYSPSVVSALRYFCSLILTLAFFPWCGCRPKPQGPLTWD